MRVIRNIAGAAALLGACLALPSIAQQLPARSFDPVGRWRFHHTDGTAFIARLAADQSAATDWEGGEHGIWRWDGSGVRVIYTDGWDDLLILGPNGVFVKKGWSPQADRCAVA